MKNTRVLKIYTKIRFNKWTHSAVPEIRLCGKWLKEAGFNEGSRVEVEVGSGVMVLKLLNG